jgi:hypothetical protein
VPDFRARIRATRCSSQLAAHLLIDGVSRPAAPRWRLTTVQAWYRPSRVILPVRECSRGVRGSTLRMQAIRHEQTTRGAGAAMPLRLFFAPTWPSRQRTGGPGAVDPRGLTGPLPCGASLPLSSGSPLGLLTTGDLRRTRWSPQGARAQERPALAAASPRPAAVALSRGVSRSCDPDRRGTSSVRCSHRFLPVTPPRTLRVIRGYSPTPRTKGVHRQPTPSASDA